MISIDEKYLEQNGIKLEEVLAGLLCKLDTVDTIDKLLEEHRLLEHNGKVYITQGFNDAIDSVVLSSDTSIPSYETCLKWAKKLRKLVPQIPKKGTPYYYMCNNAEVTLSLQRFFYYYKEELKFFYAQSRNIDVKYNWIFSLIEQLTSNFYSNFTKDNAKYFPLLKYFIIKLENGDVSSPLMSEMEMIRDGTNRTTAENN